MLFNSLQFAVFFVVVWGVYRALSPTVEGRRLRGRLLLVASLTFYSLWLPEYLLLLLADVGVNYVLLRRMAASARPRRYLVVAVVFTLGVLATFKYAGMVVSTLLPVLDGAGLDVAVPELFLPLGISFYSFQILALSVDVCRGDVREVPSFGRYLLFVSFFPQLVAGPILRGPEFLPQLERGGECTTERTRRGLWLLVAGVAKKVVLADWLLAPFVDEVFAGSAVASTSFHWVALYGFAFQIYYDFSGYCDMARGMALLLGFELPFNFQEPYLSRDPSEFWRRWHMTLSRWLADYLYVPLGGNRRGAWRTQRNLMLTMLLGGLWHGASWTFVVWGGLHGLLLVVYRRFVRRVDPEAPLRWRDAPRILVLFHLVVLIWVFFRAESFAGAAGFLQGLLPGLLTGVAPGPRDFGWPVLPTLAVTLCAVLHLVERLVRERLPALQAALAERPVGLVVEGATFGAIVGLAVLVAGAGGEFIYFQF